MVVRVLDHKLDTVVAASVRCVALILAAVFLLQIVQVEFAHVFFRVGALVAAEFAPSDLAVFSQVTRDLDMAVQICFN